MTLCQKHNCKLTHISHTGLTKSHSCPYCIRELEDKCLKENTKREQIKEIREWLLNHADFGTYISLVYTNTKELNDINIGSVLDTKKFLEKEFDERFLNK